MIFTNFIWDYDGTLFDTYTAVTRAYHGAAKNLGIDIPFDEMYWLAKHSLGWAAKQLSARFGVSDEKILAEYYNLAPREETMEAMRPYPGTAEALRAVCEKGGRNFLYSHRDHTSVDSLRHYGLYSYFSGAITKDDHFPRKPAPDALLSLIARYALDPAQCVMIGDRSLDVEAGVNAGMAGALFDPEDFCKGQAPTQYQYRSMRALQSALIDADLRV